MRHETFSTPGPVTLEVKIPSGDLDVETGDTEATTVELEVHGRDGEEAERNTRIELRRRGEGYEVVVDAERNSGIGLFRGRGDYRVRITAPHDATLRAQVASADIRGRGRYAEVDVKAASGDVELEQVAGEASINTASGDIEVERVGSGKINSASGDVQIDETSGAGGLAVNTASGDIDLKSVASGEVKVNSASGDVEVGIAKGSRLWVDAQSLSGDTSSELDLESGAPIESDEGPLVELKARTMSGDITVKRA